MSGFWFGDPDFRAPDQGLDWRWVVATWLVDNRRRVRHRDDVWVRRAVRLLRWLQRHDNRPPIRSRDLDLVPLYMAWRLWQAGGPPRWYLQGRLLCFEPAQETATACGLSDEVVEAYQALFFDRPGREANGYIAAHVFPGLWRRQCFRPDDLEGLVAFSAWVGEPLVLDEVFRVLMQENKSPGPTDPADLEALEAALNDIGARMWVQSRTLGLDAPQWVYQAKLEILAAYRGLRQQVQVLRELARLGGPIQAPGELLAGLTTLRTTLDEQRPESLTAA